MSWIQKRVTPMVIAANRANSRKSTGPRTALGKRRVACNAGKYFIFGQISPSRMRELGEDPAEFEKLRQSLRAALGPQDNFEEILAEEMAVNRWRLGRVRRAEMGILAVQQMRLEKRLGRAPANRGLSYDNLVVDYFGLSGVSETAEKYLQIVQVLTSLVEKVEHEGFCPEGLKMLRRVYGVNAGVTGGSLISRYKEHLDSRADDSQPQSHEERVEARESFLSDLEHEIRAFVRHAAAIEDARDIPLSESDKDAELIPGREDIDRIYRYEVMLQREFERLQRQLLEWRSRECKARVR